MRDSISPSFLPLNLIRPYEFTDKRIYGDIHYNIKANQINNSYFAEN